WRLADEESGRGASSWLGSEDEAAEDKPLTRKLHQTIAAVGTNIESLSFNKAVANLYELASAVEKAAPSPARSEAVEAMVRLSAPMVPHLAEQAWAGMGKEGLVADAPWPEADPALLVEDEVTIAVQVNGKLRDTLTAPKGAGKDRLEAMALGSDKIVRQLEGKAPRKVIVIPDRLVNIVA
ncbi:MAG TPA: class I tRNA ligase family protein, partial [Allosphingosinicella sp.]|nr:class I tRNA ligase family protein [Allosphingosinicella sp.]